MNVPKDTVFAPDDSVKEVDMTGISVTAIDDDTDPVTEINSSGCSITRIEDEYDPETEINSSGRSIIRIEDEYDPETESNCSGRSVLLVENEPDVDADAVKKAPPVLTDDKAASNDPLSAFETEAADFTGICMSHADAAMQLADPETEINSSGRSIIRIEDEYDPETESNCSGRSVLLVDDEGDPTTDVDATGCGIGRIS
ncbi:MAG: hypothetical protein ACI4NO_03065 [Oxalobacter sp.]